MNDRAVIHVPRTTAVVGLLLMLASPLVSGAAAAAVMHWRMGEAERRIEALEANAKWQNELLYRVDEKLKYAPWGKPTAANP